MPRKQFNRIGRWAGLSVAVSLCATALWAQGASAVPGYQPSNSGSPNHAKISATPTNYSGACPVTITVQGSLNYKAVGGGANLRYLFERNNGSTSAIGLMSLNANAPSSLPVSDSFQVNQSTQGWDQISASLYIQGQAQPSTRGNMTGVQSNRAAFSVNCISSSPKLGYKSPAGLEPVPAPARPGGYTPFQPSNAQACARPVLVKISDRTLQVGGSVAVLAEPGDNMQMLANTSLPAQVTFSAGSQQGQGVSASLNPNKLNQTQAYMATSLIVVVPSIATVSTQPIAGWVEVSDQCGASNRLPLEFQGPPAGPYRVQPKSGYLSAPRPIFQPNRSPMAQGSNTAPTWTGVVQGAPAYSSFWLKTGDGRVLSVLGGQARYVAGGQPEAFASLKPGMRIKVTGSLSYNKIMAREVEILPGTDAAPLPEKSPAPSSPPLTPQQKALQAQRLAALQQAMKRTTAEMHGRELALQAKWQQQRLARRVQLYSNLLPHVQDAQSRQAVQQQIGIYNRGIAQLTTLRQPIQLPKWNGTGFGGIKEGGSGAIGPGGSNASCSAPAITSLSVSSGQPNDPVLITGTNFGTAGAVQFVINPAQTVQDSTPVWSDTQVFASVPAVTGIASSYNGVVYVTNNCGRSNMVSFQFQPQIVVQQLPIAANNVQWSDPACPSNWPSSLGAIESGCKPSPVSLTNNPTDGSATQGLFGSNLAGAKDNDEFFQGYMLKNGWALDSWNLLPDTDGDPNNTGVSVTGAQIGSPQPRLTVHSWVNASGFHNTYVEGYQLMIFIHGPAGVPYQ